MTDQITGTDPAKKGVVHLTTGDFQQSVSSAGMPVFVDFYADWCGPCKFFINKLATEFEGKVLMAKVNVDEQNDVARQYGVMSIPTVVILQQDGDKIKELDRKIGFPGEEGYRQMLKKVVPASKD